METPPAPSVRAPRTNPWNRLSFAARLLAALLAAVGLVLCITLVVVRQQTAAQVRLVTRQVTERSREAFREIEEVQRFQLAVLGDAFTESPRTRAALEAALEGADVQWLAETARYELLLRMLSHSLAAFSDPAGRPIVTLVDGQPVTGDEATLQPLIAHAASQGDGGVLTYRVLRDELYVLQARQVGLDGYRLGTVTFGLPLGDADAERLGAVLGVELCFVADGRCIAGTPLARDSLHDLLIRHSAQTSSARVRHAGKRWLLISDALAPDIASDARRVMAVPMDDVLHPLDTVQSALTISGFGALAVAILLSIVFSRGLTRPLRALAAATERVGRGDYTVRVPVQRQDEIGMLGDAFNAMTEGLALKERYRGVLDKVVAREVAEDLLRGEIMLGGENRTVTTLFADLAAFSTLVEGMPPQQVIALLNECMERLEAVVQAHGGVVDKYIGDEIMAIFGAPVSRPDDAQRALRTALDMQDAMLALNGARRARGEPTIGLAIGMHTGVAVAGNMGSPNRLNYTVVGDAVNLAARLCSAASAGEILVTEATWAQLRDEFAADVAARPLGTRALKGFTEPVPVVALGRRPAHATSHTLPAFAAIITAGALALSPALHAQQPDRALPTLEELGVRYTSASGFLQLDLGGRLDLEAYAPQDAPPWLIPTTSPFVAGRIRLLADLFVGERLYALAELRADRGHAPADTALDARVEQVFLRLRPLPAIALQAGKFASPFGAYAARHLTEKDPLIRPPLPYDYRTLAAPRFAPAALDGFLDWKNEADVRRPRGAPVIWDVPYPWGALVTAGAGRVGVRAALLSSAPGSAPETWRLERDRLRHPTLVFGAAAQPLPELAFGLSWARGPFLEPLTAGTLPPGTSLTDFVQEVRAIDATFARGHITIHGELFFNRWEVPNLDEDPRDTSFYLETSATLLPGLFAAARYGMIRFNHMGAGTTAGRAGQAWDLDHQRLQLGAGYRIVRNVEIRAEYMINRTSGRDPGDNLAAVQLWWMF